MTETPPLLKSRWKLVVVLLAAVLLAALAVRWWRGTAVAVETVVRRDFVQSVVASGRVETAHRVEIGSQITGTVVRVPVNRGAERQGRAISWSSWRPPNSMLPKRQADMAVAQAQGRRRQMREVQVPVAEQALREAEANLANARSLLHRNQELAQRGFISKAALGEFDRAVAVADAQVKSTQRQLETARPAGSDYALADAALAEARASADLAGARADYAVIRAPVSGTLIGRNIEVGDVVQAGQGADDPFAGRPHATGGRDRREESSPPGARPERAGLPGCLSPDALCRRPRLHQPGHQCPDRGGTGQARRAVAAGGITAGHDGVRGHRGGAASERHADSGECRA